LNWIESIKILLFEFSEQFYVHFVDWKVYPVKFLIDFFVDHSLRQVFVAVLFQVIDSMVFVDSKSHVLKIIFQFKIITVSSSLNPG
jgi:hypothetical protein